MSETHASTVDHYEPGLYEIRIKGHLEDRWSNWFGGLTITLEDSGDTLVAGPVVDQAALHGLLKKVRDLGMPLISVNRVEPGPSTALPSAPLPSTPLRTGRTGGTPQRPRGQAGQADTVDVRQQNEET